MPEKTHNSKDIKIAVLCGGPSLERGISLNSARSVLDHVGSQGVEIIPIYFTEKREAYKISPAQLYSNTPSDFDFKLRESGKKLKESALVKVLKGVTIVFPAIHGPFGEDGEIQTFLEKHKIPFVGSGAKACKLAFDKYKANEYIHNAGFYAPPSEVFKITDSEREIAKKVRAFWSKEKITRAIVKPASGGSSVGVFSVESIEKAQEAVRTLFRKRMDTRVVIQPFMVGKEFTIIVLQNKFNNPVALIPSEIEMDYNKNQVFDFRRKYLPTNQVTYHCPPRFSNEVIEKIQIEAEQLFSLFGMQDFVRFDGFLLPDGNIWFSDFNPVSGMEQNSFLFQQASRIGFSHQDLLRFVIHNSLRRQGIQRSILHMNAEPSSHEKRKPVAVIFGGNTAEKQVSLMSGTNVWLKLRGSKLYEPHPYLLDQKGRVWELPYSYILNHTVEEITENAQHAAPDAGRLNFLIEKVALKLFLEPGDATEKFFLPKRYALETLLDKYPFVFSALHGGVGEDGTLQKILETHGIKYNGSPTVPSRLCMDKWETNKVLHEAKIPGVDTVAHELLVTKDFHKVIKNEKALEEYWERLIKNLGTKTVIAKPRGDGCSAGVVRLFNSKDLETYIKLIKNKTRIAKAHTFTNQPSSVDMPEGEVSDIIFEAFVETDKLKAKDGKIAYTPKSGYVEMTIGVLEENKKMHALSPSITIAEETILSVEEKFQGGTGVNITPPPANIISAKNLDRVKRSVERVAETVGLRGYARIDTFVHAKTGNIIVIEINTLPGLTPSTVLYHQALAEPTPIYPVNFLEMLIKNKGY